MANIKKYIILGFIILPLVITGCGRKDSSERTTSVDEENKDMVKHKILSFDLEGMTEKGVRKWDVKGDSAESVSESELKLANIVANTYGDSEATITADEGMYDKAKNSVRLEKNVKAVINSAAGEGFDGNFADFGGQAASSKDKTGEPKNGSAKKTNTVITCDGEAQFEYTNSLAYFNKNVKVASDDGNIDADKITANLDMGSKKVDTIVAEGNVKIVRGKNISYSQKAVYVEPEKKIILTGRPRLILYQEEGSNDNFPLGSGKGKK